MEIKSIHERILEVDCEHAEQCNLRGNNECLKCIHDKNAGESYFVDKDKLELYRAIKRI